MAHQVSGSLRGAGYALFTATVVLLLGLTVMDQDWGMSAGPLLLTWLAGAGATLVLLMVWMASRASAASRDWPHALVPLLFAVVAPVLVAAGGPARDRVQTTVLWTVLALLTHAVLTVLTAAHRVRWRARTASLIALALVFAAAVGVERASQASWRARDFRAVGVPLVVPEVPGYLLSRAAPGQRSIFVILSPEHPTFGPYQRIGVEIGPSTPDRPGSCRRAASDRFLLGSGQAEDGLRGLVLCLDGHDFQMWLIPIDQAVPDLDPLLDQIKLRRVGATDLARYPAGWTWEPD